MLNKDADKCNLIPEKLYRYMPWNSYAIDTLVNHSLHLSSPYSFNDEFELLVPIFRDMFEAQLMLNDINYESNRIVCFSKSYQNSMMWYNYAGRGSGICLEFTNLVDVNQAELLEHEYSETPDISHQMKMYLFQHDNKPHIIGRVHYTDHMPDIKIARQFSVGSIGELCCHAKNDGIISYMPFFFKNTDWITEKEIRIVRLNTTDDFYKFDKLRLTGVYTNSQMSTANKEILKRIVDEFYPHAVMHNLVRKKDDYGYEKEGAL